MCWLTPDLIPVSILLCTSIQLTDKPYQPISASIRPQTFETGKRRRLLFQDAWYSEFPWLHYGCELQAVVCFNCVKEKQLSVGSFCAGTGRKKHAFVAAGFTNWKKAKERFVGHQSSVLQRSAVVNQSQRSLVPVSAQLSCKKQEDQKIARSCLNKIVTSVHFLARQGITLRGHIEGEGNFIQLLKLRQNDSPELQTG
jgi:hypothetical protein